MYLLRLLGDVQFETPAGPVTGRAAQRRRVALLACLAVARHRPVSRDKLLARLWPDTDTDRARHLLSDSIYLIRRELGEAVVLTSGEHLRLNEDLVRCDVTAFEDAIDAADPEGAAAQYGGPFLDGFHVGGSAEFEHWLMAERDRFARMYAGVLEQLARARESEGAFARAADWWRRLASHEPTSARVVLAGMRALDLGGDRAGAIRLARVYIAMIHDQYGIEPDPAVLELMEQLSQAAPAPSRPAEPAPAATEPTRSAASANTSADRPSSISGRAEDRPTRRRKIAVPFAVLALALAGILALRLAARSASPVRILVAQATGDTLVGDYVAEQLRQSLARSPRFAVLGDAAIAAVLQRMGQPDATRLTPEVARDIAIREGLPAFIRVDVVRMGDAHSITVALVSAGAGEIRDSDRVTARTATEIVYLIDRVTGAVRRRFGESAAAIERSSRPFPVTTDSVRALLLHRDGFLAWRLHGDLGRALELTEEALAVDPRFAHAHLQRAWMLEAIGAPDAVYFDAVRQAYALRARLPAYERYMIEGFHRIALEGDLHGAVDRLRAHVDEGKSFRPGEAVISFLSLSAAYVALDDLGTAEQVLQESRRWYPGPFNQAFLVRVLHALDRDREALEVLDEATARFPRHPWLEATRAHLAAVRGEYDRAHALALPDAARPDTPNGLKPAALFDAVQGRYMEAIAHLTELRQQLSGRRTSQRRVELTTAIGRLHLAAGDTAAAGEEAERLLTREPLDAVSAAGAPALLLAALFADAGRPRRARELLNAYEAVVRPDVALSRQDLLIQARAAILLAEDSAARALELLRERAGPESMAPLWFNDPFISRVHRPLLARAYERAGQPDSAIAVWRRYLDVRALHRAELDAFHLATALRRLSVLHEARGDFGAAAAYDRRLAELWAEGDPPQRRAADSARARVRPAEAAIERDTT